MAQTGVGRAQSRCRCGRGEPSPRADVGGVSLVPAQMWAVGLQEDKLRKLGDVVCKGEPVEAQVSGPKQTSATAVAQTGDPNERCGDECVQCLKVR